LIAEWFLSKRISCSNIRRDATNATRKN